MGLRAVLGRQLAAPSGAAGALVGHLMARANAEPNARAVAALDLDPDDDVLELGFGPGHALELIAERVTQGRIFGVERSVEMLRQAWRRNRRPIRQCRLTLLLGDFTALPMVDSSVDKILAVNVAYFWHDGAAVLAEVRRVLRPGGCMVIYATGAPALRRWGIAGPATHRLFDPMDLRALLIEGGFAPPDILVEEIVVARRYGAMIAVVTNGASGENGGGRYVDPDSGDCLLAHEEDIR